MRSILALARKELDDIVRERTILAAVFIQFLVAAFSAFLLVGLSGLYDPSTMDPGRPLEVAYVGPGDFARLLYDAPSISATHTDLPTALAGFDGGRFAAVVEETWTEPGGVRRIEVLVPEDEFQTTIVVAQLRSLLAQYEKDLRSERAERLDAALLDARLDPAPARDHAFTYGALLPLLVLMPAMLAGAITADSFLQERSTGTLRLLLASPLSAGGIVLGKLAVPVLLAPLQVGLWVFLLQTNGIPVESVAQILFFATVAALLFAATGVIVAGFVPVEGQAQATYALTLLVMSLLGFLLPRDPLNLVALLATGTTGAGIGETFLVLVAVTGVVAWLAAQVARRRLLIPDAV